MNKDDCFTFFSSSIFLVSTGGATIFGSAGAGVAVAGGLGDGFVFDDVGELTGSTSHFSNHSFELLIELKIDTFLMGVALVVSNLQYEDKLV